MCVCVSAAKAAASFAGPGVRVRVRVRVLCVYMCVFAAPSTTTLMQSPTAVPSSLQTC